MRDSEQPFLPYGRHWVDEDDVAAVSGVLRGQWLTTGPAVRVFEAALAERVGARYAVSCSSGTAALHLAALALGLAEGAGVVVPSMTFLATANAARFVGAEVAFADVDAGTGLMGAGALRPALETRDDVRAVFAVHLNGQCADLEGLDGIARERGLRVVEDACHAIGAAYRTRDGERVPVGSCRHSDMAVFSFHPVKTITMGEGGAVTTNDPALYERLTLLRNHGMVRDPSRFEGAPAGREAKTPDPAGYEMREIGFNYRASDIHCALGLSQLRKLDRFVARRRELAERYDERLRPLAPLVRPPPRVPRCEPAWHLYAARIDFAGAGVPRAVVMQRLRERGVGTQVHYFPVHRQPYYRGRHPGLRLPGADDYYERTLSLPLFPAMADSDVDRVVEALAASLEEPAHG